MGSKSGSKSRRLTLVAGVVSACAAAYLSTATSLAQPAETLARRLAAMRAEVEQLSSELTSLKTDAQNELRALARQKADLQVELEREKVRIATLRSALQKKQSAIAARTTSAEDLGPIFESALAGLRAHVERSLPFRRADRLAELDKISEQRKTGVMSYERALSRLWSFVEDELRMTRESGLFRQTVTVDDAEVLADVVRVGMVMLFYRTSDGRVGKTERTAGGWRFVELEDERSRRQIRGLLDSFKKQIRVGYFEIPNALPPRGGDR
jgi:Protein of unknown function (DUF3450)